jgi:hypothetical protein
LNSANIPEELTEKLRSLPDGLDFLLRPVREGMCSYTSLRDCSLTLEDVFLMNAYLDNEQANKGIAQRYFGNGKRS